MVEQLNGHLLVEALAIGYFSSNSAHLGTTLAHRRPAIGPWCQDLYSSPTCAAIFLLAQTCQLLSARLATWRQSMKLCNAKSRVEPKKNSPTLAHIQANEAHANINTMPVLENNDFPWPSLLFHSLMHMYLFLLTLHCLHRLVVRTSRCGRDNPGSTPGVDILFAHPW